MQAQYVSRGWFIIIMAVYIYINIIPGKINMQAEVMKQEKGDTTSRRYRGYKYCSILLSLATIAVGFAMAVTVFAVYIYIVYPQMYHG